MRQPTFGVVARAPAAARVAHPVDAARVRRRTRAEREHARLGQVPHHAVRQSLVGAPTPRQDHVLGGVFVGADRNRVGQIKRRRRSRRCEAFSSRVSHRARASRRSWRVVSARGVRNIRSATAAVRIIRSATAAARDGNICRARQRFTCRCSRARGRRLCHSSSVARLLLRQSDVAERRMNGRRATGEE